MVSATGILSNTMSLELSVGSARNSLDYTLSNPKMTRAGAGVSDLPSIYPDAINLDTIPYFQFNSGRVGGNAAFYQTNLYPFSNVNETYDAIANLTKIAGPHSIKVGAYFQHSYKAQSAFASHNGQINFGDTSANPYDSNFGYANAALGIFQTFTQANKYARPEYVYTNVEAYAQDNWKVSRRLTLDFGLRFAWIQPIFEAENFVSGFVPERFDAARRVQLITPAMPSESLPTYSTSQVGGMVMLCAKNRSLPPDARMSLIVQTDRFRPSRYGSSVRKWSSSE